MGTRRLARDGQSTNGRGPQIHVKHAAAAIADNVQGPRHRKRRHRNPASQGLKDHQAKGIGTTGKNENVDGAVGGRQV